MSQKLSKCVKKPIYAGIITKLLSFVIGIAAAAGLAFAAFLLLTPEFIKISEISLLQINHIHYGLGIIGASVLLGLIARGIWVYKNWARTVLLTGLIFFIIYYFIVIMFTS